MKYGDWQLRDESSYWNSPDIRLFPSSNSVDEGALTIEDNLRNIVRRITSKNYVLKPNYFNLSLDAERKFIMISPGEGNIQGYDIRTVSTITVPVPNTVETTSWTLGISLSYDAANNVTGDVIVSSVNTGNSEMFSGAYAYFFDECQVLNNADNILILGRIFCKDGKILEDGSKIVDGPYEGRIINKGLENDPFKENGLEGYKVEVKVNGMRMTPYDALPLNTTDVSEYDSTLHPVDINRANSTKPPTFTTNLQDYLNYVGDWYVNKYGDYMSGALRMNQFSIDRKILEDPENAANYVKDSVSDLTTEDNSKYKDTDSIFISPRTLGNLTSNNYSDFQYNWGGTIMTVVPQSYSNGLDNEGKNTGNYAALISQGNGDTGLKLNHIDGGRTSIVHCEEENKNTQNLLIENISKDDEIASIKIVEGQTFFDSYNSKGFQFYSASSDTTNVNNYERGDIKGPVSVDFRIDDYTFSVAEHNPNNHRLNTRNENNLMNGSIEDTKHIELGVSANYNNLETNVNSNNYRDPYLQLDNLRLKSNNVSNILSENPIYYKVNTIEVVNTGGDRIEKYEQNVKEDIPYGITNKSNSNISSTPYIRVKPSIYTNSAVSEDYIQVGTSKVDDILSNNASVNTKNKVVIARVDYDDSYDSVNSTTFIEQDICYSIVNEDDEEAKNSSIVFNKLSSFTFSSNDDETNLDNKYSNVIGGIYSHGNIGASSAILPQYTGSKITDDILPYTPDKEWVRLTRFGYDEVSNEDATKANKYNYTYRDSYNIEFNTNVKNKPANQIIWNYKGSKEEPITNNVPVILSYIHDEATNYPNKEYFDQNMYLHKNPTYGIRDFLQLSNAGLFIEGDVNNPAIISDADNKSSFERLGVTILGGRIYNAVYNDLAETYVKDNVDEVAEPGMVVSLNPETGKYKICDSYQDNLVVGVISDNYGILLGGKTIDNNSSYVKMDCQDEFFNIGISGKILVNVLGEVNPGDLLVSSSVKGIATVCGNPKMGSIIGKALSNSKKVEGKSYKQCLMQIMLS